MWLLLNVFSEERLSCLSETKGPVPVGGKQGNLLLLWRGAAGRNAAQDVVAERAVPQHLLLAEGPPGGRAQLSILSKQHLDAEEARVGDEANLTRRRLTFPRVTLLRSGNDRNPTDNES